MTAPDALTAFERTILHRLLEGDHPALDALRSQLSKVTVVDRELTGVGAFVFLEPGRGAVRCAPTRFVLSDVVYQLEGCENGGTAALFVENGELDTLEVYAWTDPWPDDPQIVSVDHVRLLSTGNLDVQRIEPVEERDMDLVRRQIQGESGGGLR